MGLLLMEREAAYFLSPRGPVHVSLNDLGEMDGLRGRRMQGDRWTDVLEREAGSRARVNRRAPWDGLVVMATGLGQRGEGGEDKAVLETPNWCVGAEP